MKGQHLRNVRGMHDSPRCEARTQSGEPCKAPAKAGKRRCHNHIDKGARRGAPRKGAFGTAAVLLDKELRRHRLALRRLIVKAERGEPTKDLPAALREIDEGLKALSQKKMEGLSFKAPNPTRPSGQVRRGYNAEAGKDGGSGPPFAVGNRARGMMLGLAIGNAMGITLDGQPPGSYRKITSLIGGGPDGLRPGQWSHHTAQVLLMAEGLVDRGLFDPKLLLKLFLRWREEGLGRYGAPDLLPDDELSDILALYQEDDDFLISDPCAIREDLSALVRIAPLAISYRSDAALIQRLAEQQSCLTSEDAASSASCRALALMISEALERGGLAALDAAHGYHDEHERLREIVAGSWKTKSRDEISPTGHVFDQFEAALWCVGRTTTFEKAVIEAANIGGASAAIGALTGQIAGSIHGAHAIPAPWIADLVAHEIITNMADKLLDLPRR